MLLLLPPLLLAVLEALHPQPEPTVQAMLDVATWFATFHVIQLVLIGLVALSVLLLADTFGRANAWVTRLGLGIFLVFFSAYDTLAGIGTGLAMRKARELSPTQQDGVLAVVEDWPGLGPPFALSILGTLGWVIAVGALAWPPTVKEPLAESGSSWDSRRSSCWADTRSRPEPWPSDPSSSPPYRWNGTRAGLGSASEFGAVTVEQTCAPNK